MSMITSCCNPVGTGVVLIELAFDIARVRVGDRNVAACNCSFENLVIIVAAQDFC